MTLAALTLVLLALTAVRAVPRARIVPEVLIAGGATLAAAGLAATWAAQALLSLDAQGSQQLWVFTLPWAVESIGKVLLIVGFAVAGLSLASAPHSSDRRQAPTETVPG